MYLNKVILTTDKNQSDLIIKNYDLKSVYKDLKSVYKDENTIFEIFEGKRSTGEQDEKIVLVLSESSKESILESMTYLFNNYDVYKFINLGYCNSLSSTDFKPGDIVIANTFLSDKSEEAIFLDYAVGENYDLMKFGLILNGICLSLDKVDENIEKITDLNKDYSADIYESEAYSILEILKKHNKLDSCVVVKTIAEKEELKNSSLENTMGILGFIL